MRDNLVDVLRGHAETKPDAIAFTFLSPTGSIDSSLTYRALDERARSLACQLGDLREQRVLLLEGTGPQFVSAFFGVLYAGGAAVPVAPLPEGRMLPVLEALAENCAPRCAIAPPALEAKLASSPVLASLCRASLCRASLCKVQTTDLARASGADWKRPELRPDATALIQYTSGSTGLPRGVVVSHGHLLHNERLMARAFLTHAGSVLVSWLPLHHDMGLIGNMLQSVALGARCVLLSPSTFVRKPFRWLEAIARFRADFSGAPDFAYRWCAERITDKELAELDLSGWRVAYNGAEPVRSDTLQSFASRFAPAGFRSRAFYPCYGLAEATLFVSGGVSGRVPSVRRLDCDAFEQNLIADASPDDPRARTLVSVGGEWGGQQVVIVDAETHERAPDGRVGEIWLSGESIASGYYRRAEETEQTFRAYLSNGEGPFLRTGDLGFVSAGELYIAGRIKDLLIVRGRNHYPQDVEATVRACHPSMRGSACFQQEADGDDVLTIVQEVRPGVDDLPALSARVRAAVAEEHGLRLDRLVFVSPGSVPKTSSGKQQRRACSALLRDGKLKVLYQSLAARDHTTDDVAEPHGASDDWAGELQGCLARLLKHPLRKADHAVPLVALGLDSLAALALQEVLRARGRCEVPLERLLSRLTLTELIDLTQADPSAQVEAGDGDAGESFLAWSQRRFFFLASAQPEARYQVPFAVEIRGDLDAERLRDALAGVARRHPALRTHFVVRAGVPYADSVPFDAARHLDCECVNADDAAHRSDAPLVQRVSAWLEAMSRAPFDLQRGPLWRAKLVRLHARQHVLLIVLHHAIADGWSAGVLLRALTARYETSDSPEDDTPLDADVLRFDERTLRRETDYWRAQLRDVDWSLPMARANGVPGRASVRVSAVVGPTERAALEAAARACAATPASVLLAAFQLLLSRYTGQRDLALGSIVARRSDPRVQDVIGPLLNTVVLRTSLAGDPTFADLVGRAHTAFTGALEHARVPFDAIMRGLGCTTRGETPFRAMFLYNDLRIEVQRSAERAWIPIEPELGLVPELLTLVVTPREGGLALTLDVDGAQLDRAAAEVVLAHYQRALQLAARGLNEPIARFTPWDPPRPAPAVTEGASPLVHDAFRAQARARPEAIAIAGPRTLTYAALDRQSTALAARILRAQPDAMAPLAIRVQDPVAYWVVVLAVLKSGRPYLPLACELPPSRASAQLRAAHAQLLLTDCEADWCAAPVLSVMGLEQMAVETPIDVPVSPDVLAYVVSTSGSTGEPRIVGVSHRALAAHCAAFAEHCKLDSEDRVLQFASPAFDVSAEEAFPVWARGGTVVTGLPREPARLLAAATELGLTVFNLPSSYWELLVSETEGIAPALRLLVVGSEPVRPERIAAFARAHPEIRVLHAYGLTEATITSLIHEVTGDDVAQIAGAPPSPVPLGRSLGSTEAYVLDPTLGWVGPGGQGELYLGGPTLATGYVGSPADTAARFVPNPYGAPGSRLLRTGDAVVVRHDGALVFAGRLDAQVKVRGHRIELEDIARVLRQCGAAQAVVAARGQRIVAWIELAASDLGALRRRAFERLPAYAMPSDWVCVDTWPRLVSGKIDRRALPEPARALLAGDPPRTPAERVIASIYAEVLDLTVVHRETDFFAAGGHSLLAMRAIERIRAALAPGLTLRDILEASTVQDLASRADSARGTGEPSVKPEPFEPTSMSSAPLTSAQQRLWFLDRLHGQSARYNMPLGMRFDGPLDVERLTKAFQHVVQRHPALRAVVRGGHLHVVTEPALSVQPVGDWEEAERASQRLAQEPFDLERGPLLRATLFHVSPTAHQLAVVFHHIIGDGRSLQIFLDDLSEAYRTQRAAAVPAPSFLSYAAGVHARTWEDGLKFWTAELAGSEPLWLPYDGGTNTGRASRRKVTLPVTAQEVEAVAKRAGCTVHMAVVTLTQALLYRYANQSDVRLAIPVANRGGDMQDAIGCFVNTTVLRTRVRGGLSVHEHMRAVRGHLARVYEVQDTPFDQIVAALKPDRGAANPLFEVMLLVEHDGLTVRFDDALAVRVFELENGWAKFDLTLTVRFRGRQVEAEMELDTGRFEPSTIDAMLETLQELAAAIVRDPDDSFDALRVLSPAAEEALDASHAHDVPGALGTLPALFAAQVARTPEAVAIESGMRRLTYRELDLRSNQVAWGLARRGVGPETLVALRMRRTEELVIAMLGVAKVGAAYVPIDPDYPVERQALIEQDSKARLTLRAIGDFGREDKRAYPCAIDPRQLAYVIYTSGSEGRPKGVAIAHGSVSALLGWARETYGADELSRVLASTSVCFDLSLFELFAPLTTGGTAVLVDNVLAAPDTEEITLINTVPSAMWTLLPRLPASVKTVNLAGEALPRSLVDALYERGVQAVYNLYGPTEDTTYSTWVRLAEREAAQPSIGRPLPGTRAFVLDDHGRRSPRGARGELYLGGVGLARGYLHQSARTAERFVPDPLSFSGERLYRTGDWVRQRPDGRLVYLGRRDAQVKVRGYRIEPGEVEEALRAAGARDAVVLAKQDRLVAYVEGASADCASLREAVARRLPSYLVPSLFVPMVDWPRTPSGKIDRRRLPEPDLSDASGTEPSSDTERALARMMETLLGARAIKRETSFFEVGGHSLLAMQLCERIESAFGITMGVRTLFEEPVLSRLAERIDQLRDALPEGPRPITVASRQDRIPLTTAQRRLWFLEQLKNAGSRYNVPLALEITGPLDIEAAREALHTIVARHEVLRTTFASEDGVPHQVIHEAPRVPLEVIPLAPGEIDGFLRRASETAFRLEQGPLLRVVIGRIHDAHWVLLIVMHHIICDEWSTGVMLREFSACYEAHRSRRAPELSPLTLQMADYAAWEASAEVEASRREHRCYWQTKLQGARAVALPVRDHAGHDAEASGRYEAFVLEPAILQQVNQLAVARQASVFMVLMAAVLTALQRVTGQTDMTIGTPIANRRRQTEPLIGFFVNQLALRSRLRADMTFEEVLAEARETALEAYAHQDVPFDDVVAAVRSTQHDPRVPITNVQLDVHNAPFGSLHFGGLTLTPRAVARDYVQFDLQLSVEEREGALHCFLGYDARKLSPVWVEHFMANVATILRIATRDPGERIDRLPLSGASPDKSAAAELADDFAF